MTAREAWRDDQRTALRVPMPGYAASAVTRAIGRLVGIALR